MQQPFLTKVTALIQSIDCIDCWLQGSLYGYSGLEMDNLQTLVSSTNELADTLRAVRPLAARLHV